MWAAVAIRGNSTFRLLTADSPLASELGSEPALAAIARLISNISVVTALTSPGQERERAEKTQIRASVTKYCEN